MSTIDRNTLVILPPLVDGERLDRATFHERYEAMPEHVRAELIGGVVYMVPQLGMDHGDSGSSVQLWLTYYKSFTTGVQVFENATVFLDEYGEHQPDAALRIRPEFGGRTRNSGRFYSGGPELIVEVSDSTLSIDLGPRLADYERAGVLEYVVLAITPPSVRWHRKLDTRLVQVAPDPDGLYRSTTFPGLWLDPASLMARDDRAICVTVDRGIATPEHLAFVEKLARAGGGV